jgi:hypothetical protein
MAVVDIVGESLRKVLQSQFAFQLKFLQNQFSMDEEISLPWFGSAFCIKPSRDFNLQLWLQKVGLRSNMNMPSPGPSYLSCISSARISYSGALRMLLPLSQRYSDSINGMQGVSFPVKFPTPFGKLLRLS